MNGEADRQRYVRLERMARILLLVAGSAVSGCVLLVAAWLRADRPTRVERLSIEERQALVAEMLHTSPGVYVPTWYEPRIGYTFPPGEEVELSFDTFQANSLGYRSGPVEKEEGTFRIVFVGDSWTFGSGVKQEQTFPEAVARLANRHSGAQQRVEAWTLALSGYNIFNELAALWFFIERLQPDAVVLCPSSNDANSGNRVLPNGSLSRFGGLVDQFGAIHPTHFPVQVDSYRFRSRWRLCFEQLRETEVRLRDRGIPVLFYFVVRWFEAPVHTLVREAAIESPYVVNPHRYVVGRWLNPPPVSHGTPEANEVYARMVYRGLAVVLGWQMPDAGTGEGWEVEPFERVPEGDWEGAWTEWLAGVTRQEIPESYRPGAGAPRQVTGPINTRTGLMGRATTVLVRRREGARFVDIALQRLPDARYLYPLQLRASIPSPSGGAETTTTVPAEGPRLHRFRLAIPDDLPAGTALDVELEAAEAVTTTDDLHGRSVFVKSIEQQEG